LVAGVASGRARSAGHHDVELVAGDFELVEFLGVTVQRAHKRDVVNGDGLAPIEEIGQARVLQVYSSFDRQSSAKPTKSMSVPMASPAVSWTIGLNLLQEASDV